MKDSRRRPGRGMPFRNTTSSGKRVNWRATLRALLVLTVLLSVLGGAIGYSVVRRGLSTHAEPSAAEEMVARAMRRWATPQSVRNRANPVQPTPEALDQALAHYADHCATCHANDGSGDTAMGRGFTRECPTCEGPRRNRSPTGSCFRSSSTAFG
jgi:hypothetical protein